jgi:hypothetical protein
MGPNTPSESIKGPLISGLAVVLSALISSVATIFGTFATGHLTTPSDTREFQKTKQENTRLQQDSVGLQQENSGLRQENTGLKQQNASLHEELAQGSTSPVSQPQESAAAESKTQTADDFVSQLDGCKKTTGAVTCVLRVTNTKQDHVVRLYNNWTSIVDSAGNEQQAKVARIGASTSPSIWGFAETTLPTNVPVKVSLTFEGVDSDVNRLSILTLGMQCLVNNALPEKETIQFRSIPLH